MRRLTLLGALLSAALALSCSSGESGGSVPTSGGPTSPDDDRVDSKGTVDASAAPARCEEAPVPLAVEETDGHLSRLYVEAELDSKRVALMFDTGSATTFVERPRGTPDPVRHAADILIGTCSVPVDGRPYPNDEVSGGLDVVGTLGADTLLGAEPSELDLAGKRIVRSMKLPLDADIMSWPTVRIDIVKGHLLAHVMVDGQPLRLMVDTGSPHLLWVGRSGETGDQKVRTSDAEGNALTLYLGTADLKLAEGLSARTPILRAPSFPYFEETARLLGGNVSGLIGLSALGRRRIVVDRDTSVLRVHP